MQRSIDRMADNVGDDESLLAAMQRLAAQRRAKLAEIAGLESDLAAAMTNEQPDLPRMTDIARREDRARVAAAMPGIVDRLTFKPDGTFRITLKDDWFVLRDGRLTRAVRPEPGEKPARGRVVPRRRGEDAFAHAAREMADL
jgi:hypothetical protein